MRLLPRRLEHGEEASVVDHLGELRSRIFFCLIAIVATTTVTYIFNGRILDWLERPLPKGTKVHATAWYDNSTNNKFNPDPTKEVRWGLQNWEEMSNCFLGMVVDMKTDPNRVFYASGASLLPVTGPGPTLAALGLEPPRR